MFKFKTVVPEFKHKYSPQTYFLVRGELAMIEY